MQFLPIPKDLPREAMHMLSVAINGATGNFKAFDYVFPVILFVKQGKPGTVAMPMDGTEDKDKVALVLGNLRKDCDAVCMISEAWIVNFAKHPEAKYVEGESLENHPCREEVVTVNLYIKNRMLSFDAPILRNPSKLGEWYLRNDSAKNKIEGRFA